MKFDRFEHQFFLVGEKHFLISNESFLVWPLLTNELKLEKNNKVVENKIKILDLYSMKKYKQNNN